MCDFSVCFAALHQFAVRAYPYHIPFVQHDNLLRVHDRADALRHDEFCGFADMLVESVTERRFGFIVQCGKAVVEEKNLRFLCDSSGNLKTLSLTSGDVCSVLRYRAFEFAGLRFDKVGSLSDFRRVFHIFIIDFITAELQI